jgi:hypothetical protein
MNGNILLVGGTFDDNGGKNSHYFNNLATAISVICNNPDNPPYIFNGGHYTVLELLLSKLNKTDFKYIFWFADVPNDKPKLLSQVKEKWPKAILVTSKRNDDDKYTLFDLVFRALNVKANLIVEFKKNTDNKIAASVYDPLGNIFCKEQPNISVLADTLMKRLDFLGSMTRQGSVCDGPALPVPNKEDFFSLVREYAEVYHNIIHGANTSRMLGNVSFRCEKGFPSFRDGEVVYVSKRNMDKRMIGVEGFVAIDLDDAEQVRYCGDVKPSVDAPVQTALYRKYPWINYMLHSHVYIKDAPFTKKNVPCGAMEEVDEIVEVIENSNCKSIRINLIGHGSLVLSNKVEDLIGIPYIPRTYPEPIIL